MFLQQAWKSTTIVNTGLLSFDKKHTLTIDEVECEMQCSVFSGAKNAKKYSRQRAYSKLTQYKCSPSVLAIMKREQNSEFAYYKFSYPRSKGGDFIPFLECLIRTRHNGSNTVDIVFQNSLARKELGFSRSTLATNKLLNELTLMHSSRSQTELLARKLIGAPKYIREQVKEHISQHFLSISKDELMGVILTYTKGLDIDFS